MPLCDSIASLCRIASRMANSPVIPWDYYQTIRKQQQADDDPIGKAMSVLHADDTHAAVLNGGNPDQVARANQLAPQIGEHPALIEDRLDDVQRGLNAGALSKVAQDHPGLGQHLAANPRTATVAQGDHQSLGMLGRAWEFAKGVPDALHASYYQTASNLSDLWTSLDEAVLSIASPNTMTETLARREAEGASYRARKQAVSPKSDSFVVRSAWQGVESIGPSLLAAGAGLLTRNPNVAAGMMGVTTGAPAYREALRAGKGTGDALRYAIEQGGVEALTERMPAGEWLDALTKRTPVGKAILRSLAEEIPGEQVATVLQDFSEWVNLHPEKPFSAYLEERPAAALATAIATVTGTSAQVGATRVLQGVVDSSVRTVAKVAAGRREAEAAHGEAAVIDAMGRAAQNSELRKRDPEAFNGLIADLAEKNGAETVFVPAEAAQTYMQSDSYDQYTDPMERYRAQIEEAAATGGDVVLPAEFALGTLPGTPAWNALKDDMRLSAGGMSAREADDLHGRLDEVMGQIGEVAGKQAAQTMAEETAHAKIVERVRAVFEDAGLTPETARVQAELIALKETVRAARMGKQLTGDEFGTEVRQVLPPALAEARAADETDLVINALRKGGQAGSQGGQSLLDWIASRGGIEDKGGDLTAMGADKWHREKKFRRKLLKPYTEAQGNLIGGAHNPNSIESTFDAAVSAGYFPELLAQRENGTGYADALDVNAFKAAIADELAGRPRHAEEAKTDPYRAAADELATLLGQRGIDPDGLSDAELRSVIDQLGQAEDGGRGFDQAAYHGSPHIFDRFSLDHIGTGEGAQAYGWGLYFAGRKEIAEHYRSVLSEPTINGREMRDQEWASWDKLQSAGNDVDKAISKLEATIAEKTADGSIRTFDGLGQQLAILKEWKKNPPDFGQVGRLYHVEIPEDDEYLLWDKPLSEQPEKVKAALEKMKGGDKAAEDLSNDELFAALGGYEQTFGDKEKTGQGFYKELSADLARKNGQKDADEGNGRTMVNPTVHYNDKLASQFLHDLGIAGIKYLDGGSRSDGTGTHNYVVFDDSRVSIQQYEQTYGDGPRGRIRFERTRTVIELFQSRNLSTLTHELGHQWLEDLRVDAESPDAPDQVKADWQTVQDWFASQGHPLTDGVIPVEAHELFARGVERYFMEGKAPSSALTRVFEAIRGWMLAVYRTVDKLRAPISPEIREVFDRMLATDEEIAQARERQALEPLFKDAATIGMTGPEFDAYTRQVQGARDEANATLLAKTMAAIRRREEKAFRDERAGVWADEAERLDQSPILSSLAAMKETPISKEWLVDRFGVDVLDLLPKRVPPLYRDGGAHPDAIAEENGFASGEEMVKAILGVEAQHRAARDSGDKRTMRQRMIDQAADAEMTRRHGDDPFNSGAIEAEALAAVNGELQGELLATEVRALARKSGKKPTPYALAREWARGKVRGGTVALEASPAAIQRHARNVAKAGRAAEQAMMKGDNEAALVAKQQQMVASALLAEAKAAADEIDKAQTRMAKVAKAKTMASVDQDYLERAQSLLEAVDLRPRSQRSIDRQAKWEAWAAARRAEGYDVIVPDSFAASLEGTHWSRMTVEALLGLDAAVSQVMHLGRMKQTLLDGKEARDFDAVVSEAVGGMGNISGPPPKGLQERNWWDALKSKVLSADAALLKMETVFDWLDGGNPDGVFNRIVFRPIAEAQGRAQDMQKDYMGRIRDLFAAVPEEQVQRWGDKMQTPFVDKFSGLPFSPVRHRLIAMALNIGNEGNLQRLSDGYGWNAQAIENYLNETLTAEEWQFVQGVWDTIETLWPEIEALERRVNGVAPDKVEPRSFETPHGTVRGGYYPAIYDSALSMMAEDRTSSPESVLYEPGTTKATTRSSATKARADKVSEPILLDLGVINRHLGEVIHDITHREAVMQAWKFLSSRRVSAGIDEALGQEIRKQLRPWVKFVANSWAMERAGNEGLGKFFSKLRANATIVGMGFRVTTMVTQIAGYANSVEVVGEAAMAKAIAQTSASPIETFRFVMERSVEMRHRMDTMDRDLGAELARLEASNPATKAAHAVVEGKKFFFHGIGYMDRMVSVPTWIAGYNEALKSGLDEEAAAYAGDKAVRVSQGAGAPKDLAAVQRGTGKFGEALKLFTTFYSYFSAMYQRERSLGRDVMGRDARMPRNMPRLVARAWWLLIVPPMMTEVLRAAVTGDGGPDDDEWWAQWTMRKLLANVVGPIPFVRDVFEPAWNKAVKGKFFSPSSTPIQRAMDSITRAAGDVGNLARGEDTKHATKDILETAGYATGLVPGQIASATQFLVDVGQGDADPETVRDWATGLTTGKMPKED